MSKVFHFLPMSDTYPQKSTAFPILQKCFISLCSASGGFSTPLSSLSKTSLEFVIVVMLLQFGSMDQITHTQKIGHSLAHLAVISLHVIAIHSFNNQIAQALYIRLDDRRLQFFDHRSHFDLAKLGHLRP